MRPQPMILFVAFMVLAVAVFMFMREPPAEPSVSPSGDPPAVSTPHVEPAVALEETRTATAPAGEARVDLRVIEDSGERVVGCDVELRAGDGAGQAESAVLARGTSGGGGALRFDGLALGAYVLRVVDADYVGDDVPVTLTEAMGFGQAVVMVRRKP